MKGQDSQEQKKYKEQYFSQLYDEHLERIYRFVYYKVSSESATQDICSDVFTNLWKQVSLGKEVKNPSAFLFTLARNSVIDHYRKNDKEKNRGDIDDYIDIISDKKQDIHKQAELKDDMKIVNAAMNEMKEEYRQAIFMYYIEQEPITEVARSLGKTQGAARVIVSRGMKQLRQILES
ncbi:MAG: RNA polymerase sigma factor [Candidatus Pacebacteria bacterium]|nr:RNA polymerase sigma factor [Candidatus Paceibacterota bacterium]